ncbi:MAG TPA: PDZ domain-containing protein [Candidatus Saccharimonadales bacterium]|nr:PDZ domain-containing protein [Candidatus Saccharimonadales bacterium]
MNTAVAGNGQNISFAIPINEIKSTITTVKTQGKIIRPYLGVRYLPITKQIASQYSLSTDQGAYVIGNSANAAVLAGSPADKAGLKNGDIIVRVGSDSITDSASLTTLIAKHSVGETVQLTIIRDGKSQSVNVTLEAAPQ